MHIKLFNKYYKVVLYGDDALFKFNFFEVDLKNKKNKAFKYFENVFKEKEVIEELHFYVLMFYHGEPTTGYEGRAIKITITGFLGNKVFLNCQNTDMV